LYFYNYFVESAVNKGIIPFNWDTGPYGNNTSGIFDRNTGAVVDQGLLDAIMQAAGKGNTTSIIDKTNLNIPDKAQLEQNYPNPFNPATKIRYSLSKAGLVTLKVYDLMGEEVETLINEHKNIGIYEVSFDAANLPSGVYFYKIQADNYIETRKMLLIK